MFSLLKNYFNFALHNEKETNFEKYFNNKYNKEAMITKIDNLDINDFDKNIYHKIKDFFITFNNDVQVQTFTENTYKKFDFNYLRLITKEDLMWVKFYIENSKETDKENLNSKYDETILKNLNKNDRIFYEPVDWETFLKSVKEILEMDGKENSLTDKNSKQTLKELDEIFFKLTDKLKIKKFNFKNYKNLFRETKTSLMLNALKYGIFIDKRDPDFQIIRESNKFI